MAKKLEEIVAKISPERQNKIETRARELIAEYILRIRTTSERARERKPRF